MTPKVGNRVERWQEVARELERSRLATPKVEDCLRALGPPTFRDDTATGSESWLIYELPTVVIKVGCARGRLSTIQMDRRE